jgi:hypothetical protein
VNPLGNLEQGSGLPGGRRALPLSFTNHPAQVGFESSLKSPRPFHLTRMYIPALFHHQTFSHTGITLLDLKTFFGGCFEQTLARSVLETPIGWIPKGLVSTFTRDKSESLMA